MPTDQADPLRNDREMAATRAPTEKQRFCAAAKLATALAATAMPFATTKSEEAERWFRILRVNGAVGNAMQGLGLPEQPLVVRSAAGDDHRRPDSVEAVIAVATSECRGRGTDAITTADLLVGVMSTYGPAFEQALTVRGTTPEEVMDLVANPRMKPLARTRRRNPWSAR